MVRSTTIGCISKKHWALVTTLMVLAVVQTDARAGTVSQKYKDWIVDCPARKACVAHLDQKGVQILAGRMTPKEQLRVALRISALAQKGTPVALRLDNGWQAGLRVDNCAPAYCEAGVAKEASDRVITALLQNSGGIIAYEVKDHILLIPFSLSGFPEAIGQVGR